MLPVRAYHWKAKLTVQILGAVLRVASLFLGKNRKFAPSHFHDDPRNFSKRDIFYFAYKYYLSSPVLDDASGVTAQFFRENKPIFSSDLKNKTIVTLHAAGDLMPYSWIQKQFCKNLWADIETDFRTADITFANLETPVLTSKPPAFVPEIMLSDMLFNADAAMCDLFFNSENGKKPIFDVLSTANNHALDQGVEGVSATIKFLKEKEIYYTGTSTSKSEVFNFPIIEKNGIRVAFIAFTYSLNQFMNPKGENFWVNHLEVNQPNADLSAVKILVQHAKTERDADFVVLSLHFSNAYQVYPNAHIVQNTKRIFSECGVDIILGGHAHNVQPSAKIDFVCPFSKQNKSGFIVFSMGDFIANDIFTWCKMPLYVKIVLSKGEKSNSSYCEIESVALVPVFVYSEYENENHRNLRLLRLENVKCFLETKIAKIKTYNLEDFETMKKFYQNYIDFNNPDYHRL